MTERPVVGLPTEVGVVAKEMRRSYLNTGRERKRHLHEDWEVPEGFAISGRSWKVETDRVRG